MSRWGTEDGTDGGNAARYSLSARWSETNKHDSSRVEAFIIHNDTNFMTTSPTSSPTRFPAPATKPISSTIARNMA